MMAERNLTRGPSYHPSRPIFWRLKLGGSVLMGCLCSWEQSSGRYSQATPGRLPRTCVVGLQTFSGAMFVPWSGWLGLPAFPRALVDMLVLAPWVFCLLSGGPLNSNLVH